MGARGTLPPKPPKFSQKKKIKLNFTLNFVYFFSFASLIFFFFQFGPPYLQGWSVTALWDAFHQVHSGMHFIKFILIHHMLCKHCYKLSSISALSRSQFFHMKYVKLQTLN
jgi:fumarate reductase subunit D